MVGHTYQTANVQNSPHQNIAYLTTILWRAIQVTARNPKALLMEALCMEALRTEVPHDALHDALHDTLH
jgi:hypothetical protein